MLCRYISIIVFLTFDGVDMSKAKMVVRIGYTSFVLDAAKAVQVLDMLSDAELYESKWYPKDEDAGVEAHYKKHIWENDNMDTITVEYLPHAVYAVGKVLGKPPKP